MAGKSGPGRKSGLEAGGPRQATVGSVLLAQREQRALTIDEVAAGAHIPAHYLKMIETDNFSLISDQLYLLPFLRRYAEFLGLEPDEMAMRFIREAQRAESAPIKALEPLPLNHKRHSRWLTPVAVVLVAAAAAAAVVLYRRAPRELRPLMARPTPVLATPAADASAAPALPAPSPALPQAGAPMPPRAGFAPPPATPAAAVPR